MKMVSNVSQSEKYHLIPFEVGYLPDFYLRKSRKELNETPENRKVCLQKIREYISKEKTFDCWSDFDDEVLLQYLRVRKFDVNRSCLSLQAYVSLRRKEPSLWNDIEFERLRTFVERQGIAFLPHRCPDGCAILWFQLDKWDPTEFPAADLKRVAAVFFQQAIRDPMTQVNGYKVIFEMTTNPFKYIRHFTPQNLYLLYHGTTECIPGRYKAIHVVNDTWFIKVMFVVTMQFVSRKMQDRTFFHSDCKKLLDFFPKSVLPSKYGGEVTECNQLEWFRKACSPENVEKLFGCH